MDDDFWRRRIARPEAKTFVAVSNTDREILSSVTIVRGTAISPLMGMAIGLLGEERDKDSKVLLHWAVNGVYTAQHARRQGLSKAVFKGMMEYAFKSAEEEGKSCLVTILARDANALAVGMYKRMGFTAIEYVNDDGNLVLYLLKREDEST